MTGKFKIALTAGAAVALVFSSALTAQATEEASGTVKAPYASKNKVVGWANLNGPNAPGTIVCVSLLAAHPYTPDIEVAKTCKKIDAGTVTTTTSIPPCGKYTTLGSATYKGRTTWFKKSSSTIFCK